MNLKVRVKNWSFWVSIVISIFTPILAYFGITAQDITTWGKLGHIILNAISNPYVVLMILVSVYNTLVDTTTPGIKDSERALNYIKPGVQKNE
nr:MAG TPA: holin [Caudoviricetes sp.]